MAKNTIKEIINNKNNNKCKKVKQNKKQVIKFRTNIKLFDKIKKKLKTVERKPIILIKK